MLKGNLTYEELCPWKTDWSKSPYAEPYWNGLLFLKEPIEGIERDRLFFL